MSERLVVTAHLPPTAEDISVGYIEHPVAEFQAFTVFDVSGNAEPYREAAAFRKEQFAAYRAGDIRNPVLNNCPGFQLGRETRRDMYRHAMTQLHMQQLRLADGGEISLEHKVAAANLALKINELGYIEVAALIAEEQLAPEERQQMGDVLRDASHDLYPLPDRNITLTIMGDRMNAVEKLAASDDEQVRDVAAYVREGFAMPTDYETVPFEKLSPEVLAEYEAILVEENQAEIDAALQSIGGPKESYTPDEMQRFFQVFIELQGYDRAGWSSEVVANKTMCLANLATKIIEIGAERPLAQRSHTKVIKSLIHEAGVHARRNALGSEMGSGMAGKGFANYTFFEEPFSGSAEDIYFGTTLQRGQSYTIALGLAMGIDGTPRDYRDTDELYWRMVFAAKYKPDQPIDSQIAAAKKISEGVLVRIWRGMPTDVPGCVLTKDSSYENTAVVRFLENGGVPLPRADFMRLLSAKYDPRTPDEDAYVRQFDPR